MKKLIEIILPFYNCSQYIEAQLNSIFLNSIPSTLTFRLLIIDDCSNEKESLYLQKICQKYENIIIYKNEKNRGVVKSIERGLSLSTADYVLLADQDDYWLPHKIFYSFKKIIEIENNKPALVFTDLCVVNSNLELQHESMFQLFKYHPEKLKNNILLQNMVTGCTIILNRKLINLALPFPADLIIHDHWLALCATYGGQIGVVKDATILYRQHERNLIGAKNIKLVSKLLNLNSVLFRKHKSHLQKSIQAKQLSVRLKERGLENYVEFLEKTSKALKTATLQDVVFLKHKQIISFNPIRTMVITSFFILIASYKSIRSMLGHE